MHKPLKSRVFFAQAVKTGVLALLLFTVKHLDQRGWVWNPSPPKWAFWYQTGWFSPVWCQRLPKIRTQLWGGNSLSRLLGSSTKSKSSMFLKRCHATAVIATHRCSDQKQDPIAPGSVQMSHHKTQKGWEAHAISVRAAGDRWSWWYLHHENRGAKAWKEDKECNIKISTSQRSDKHLGAKLLPCCGEGAQETKRCSTPFCGADGSLQYSWTSARRDGERSAPGLLLGLAAAGWAWSICSTWNTALFCVFLSFHSDLR